MKRLSYVVLALALALTAAGCSKDSEEASAAATQPVPPATSAAPAARRPAAATAPKPAAGKAAKNAGDAASPVPAKAAAPKTVEVLQGTEISVFLIDSISTAKNKAGDQFMASLADPIIVNGETVLDRGVKVQGRIVDAEGAGRVKGRANIRMVLTNIVDGAKVYPIVTRPFMAEAEATKGRDAGIIGGGAGVGAAIGAIAGGKGGAAKGAIIGGAAGTGTVLATKGKEVEFDSETKLKFTLQESADLPRIRS